MTNYHSRGIYKAFPIRVLDVPPVLAHSVERLAHVNSLTTKMQTTKFSSANFQRKS